MIVELRQYSLVPGSLAPFVELYSRNGWDVQRTHLGNCVGYYTTEIGDLNGVIHLWAYDNLSERTNRRAELNADPRWHDFLKQVTPLLSTMQNSLLTPAPFATPNPVTPT